MIFACRSKGMGSGQSRGGLAPSVAPEPNVTSESLPRMREGSHFKLILVRHGISCANLKKARGDLFASSYMDPELTRLGQIKAKKRGVAFREELMYRGMAYPIVMASMLMRAQQTAFLMMNAPQIYIAPYISELGSQFWFKTADNIPYRPSEQARIMELEGKTPFLTEDGRDRRIYLGFPEDATEPSPARFISWLGTNILHMEPVYDWVSTATDEMGANQLRNLSRIHNIDGILHNSNVPSNNRLVPPYIKSLQTERKLLKDKWWRPVIVFTHGIYIQAFIKYISKGRHTLSKSVLLNYSAFECDVTMRGGKLQFEYVGPFEYALETDDYTASAHLDVKEECAPDEDGNKDMCIKEACPGTRRQAVPLGKAKTEQIRRQLEKEREKLQREREKEEATRQAAAALAVHIEPMGEEEERAAIAHARVQQQAQREAAQAAANAVRARAPQISHPGPPDIEDDDDEKLSIVSREGGRRRTRRFRKHKRKTHKRRR